jgi:hypothetical protein
VDTTRLILREQDGSIEVLLHHPGQLAPEPAGARSEFLNPLSVEDLEELRFYLEDYLALPSGVFAARGEAVERDGLKRFGEALFDATFGPDPRRREAYGMARLEAARGGPVQVLISSANARFLGLPWELLKDPAHPEPLALHVAGFDRTLPQTDPAMRLEAGDRLRVLMVIARPDGIRDVPYATIARPLFAQLDRVPGQVGVDVLRPPTFAALKARLAAARAEGAPYHVVHFDGHGTFGVVAAGATAFDATRFYKTPAPKGYLAFEQETGAGA